MSPIPDSTRPRVVIVGAGFGGLAAARALARTPAEVTVIDRRNYHLFQPLLYQVATAALSPADIAWPIRSILARQKNAAVQMGKVVGVDRDRREVILEDRRVGFDYLVLATGARHSYFGMDEWETAAPGLKKIGDATHIRERVLLAFERAEVTDVPVERQRLLTFVVVGGGPTGVEMAGAVAELANHALARDFRAIDPMDARVILVEGGARVLAQFQPDLSAKARTQLEHLRVEVRLGAPVQHCDADGVTVGDERIAARTVIWAAGVIASPAAKWLSAKHDRAGRIMVTPELPKRSIGQHHGAVDDVQARHLCQDLVLWRRRLAEIERDIAGLLDRHEVGKLLTTIDGIGPQSAAYVGTVPGLRQSGQQTRTRAGIAPIGNARLRRALWMPVLGAVRRNPWLRACHDRLCANGKPPKLALIAGMRKLLHAVHSVARNKTPFASAMPQQGRAA